MAGGLGDGGGGDPGEDADVDPVDDTNDTAVGSACGAGGGGLGGRPVAARDDDPDGIGGSGALESTCAKAVEQPNNTASNDNSRGYRFMGGKE